MYKIKKVISGFQTGADAGGLIAAYDMFIETGGAMPKGFITENGPAPEDLVRKYRLTETASTDYKVRTRKNVVDSDATLIFGDLTGGTKLTMTYCMAERRPCFAINATKEMPRAYRFLTYLGNLTHPLLQPADKQRIISNDGFILNIAGNRESKTPGISDFVYEFVKELFIRFNA
jgi:hypothetical protein